ncbi:MAG: PKD domain-containing protein [bacterium]|nr:PKD domain-containing protein [bacterium]
MNSVIRLFLISLVSILIVSGCSNHSIPTAPGGNAALENAQGSITLSPDSSQNQHFCLLYNLIYIDVSNHDDPQYEVVPVRTGTIHLNILKFLEVTPCTNCFKLVGFNIPQPGYLNFDIQIKHPFPNTSLDLSIFDVRGIIMFNGSEVFPGSGKRISNPFTGDGAILNADGYTSLFNASTLSAPVGDFFKYFKGKLATPAAPNADVNAYLRFVTDNPSNNRNAYYAGDSVTRTYSMKIPTPTFVLGYAVDANWDIPLETPVDDPITDFPVTANCPEAWKMIVIESPIGDGLTECGGETKLTIDLYDWQGKDEWNPVRLECPEIFDSVIEATYVSETDAYTRYEADISNSNFAASGPYPCLIWHEAVENDPVGKPWQDLTAYQIYTFDVNPKVDQIPTAYAVPDKTTVGVGQPVQFDASDSVDNDCNGQSIVSYEWQWDSGGIFEVGTQIMQHGWEVEGEHMVQLRVTDDEGSEDYLDNKITITVTDNQCPTAWAYADPNPQFINVPVNFDASDSYDSDGTIVSYEWDWDFDGIYDDIGSQVQHAWSEQGSYEVQLRVTDDLGCADVLDSPLEVDIIFSDNICPTADAGFSPNQQFINVPVSFFDNGSIDPDGTLTAHEWDWNNDGIYDEDNPVTEHSWGASGTYFVQYRVIDDDGCPDDLDQPLEVIIQGTEILLPVAIAGADPNPQLMGHAIHLFDDGSYDPDGGLITNYEWDFDADGTYEETGTETWFQSGTPGTVLVQLRVTDDEAQTDLLDTPLVLEFVSGQAPVALGTAVPMTQQECGAVTFMDDGSYDPDGGLIQNYEWDLNNDGIFEQSGGGAYSAVMTEVGVHYVQYRVTDDEGMTDTLDSPIAVTITNVMPTAVATADRYYALPDEEITLNGGDSYDGLCGGNNIVLWEWDTENDGSFEFSGKILYLSYSDAGNFQVQLKVTDDEGSTDTLDIPLQIVVEPNFNIQDVTPPWLHGGPKDIAVYGNYAYYASLGPFISIMDISDPNNPVFVSYFYTTDNTINLEIDGTNLYVTKGYAGFSVYSLANPVSPTYLNSVDSVGYAVDIAVEGGYAYETVQSEGLLVIDVDPLDSAHVVKTLSSAYGGNGSVTIDGNYAYTGGYFSLLIVDIAVPELASVAGTVTLPDLLGDIAVSSGYAYITDWTEGFKVVDVSPPGSASVIKTIDNGGYAYGCCISGNTAYFTDDAVGLNIVNISDPPNAAVINTMPTQEAQQITLFGDYAITANWDIEFYDVNPPLSTWMTAHIESTHEEDAVAYKNGYGYAINTSKNSLQVIDVEPVDLAHWVASVPIDDTATLHGYDIGFYKHYALSVNGSSGLEVFDIADPENPTVAMWIPTMGDASGIAIGEGYAYVADYDAGLTIIDIDPMVSAYIVKNVPIGYNAVELAIDADYAYVITDTGGLFIVDITPISNAYIVKNVILSSDGLDVSVLDGYAYVNQMSHDISIVDIDPPESATVVKELFSNNNMNSAVRNGFWFVTGDFLTIFDSHPVADASEYIHFYDTLAYHTKGICLNANYAYVGDENIGFCIFRLW